MASWSTSARIEPPLPDARSEVLHDAVTHPGRRPDGELGDRDATAPHVIGHHGSRAPTRTVLAARAPPVGGRRAARRCATWWTTTNGRGQLDPGRARRARAGAVRSASFQAAKASGARP